MQNPQAAENAKVIDLSTVSDPQDMVHMAAIGDSVMLGSAHDTVTRGIQN